MRFEIYLIVHPPTGRGYVGMTKRGLKHRWEEHLSAAKRQIKSGVASRMLVVRALAKHNEEEFVTLGLAGEIDLERARNLEREFIAYYGTRHPAGFNLTDGGDGIWGYKFTEEQRAQLSLSHKGQKGHTPTAEQRLAASLRNKGQKANAYACGPKPPHVRAALSAARLGKKLSKKTRLAVIASNKRRKGEKRKAYPKDHGAHISAALKGRAQPEELIARRTASNRGKKRSLEFRAARRVQKLAWWAAKR